MARKYHDEDYDYEYSEEEDEVASEEEPRAKGNGSKTVFLLILGVLLLALTVLCLLLTGKLRSANREVVALQSELEAAKTVKWSAPGETPELPGSTTIAIPTPGAVSTPAPVSATPEPTPTVTPSPAPIASAGSLPSWLTEADMAKVTRRPKDDEWYGAPGKLYVIATLGLNLRSGTRTDIDNIITQIKCGSEVEVYAASGNMRFVQDPQGHFGWCSNNLLSNEPPKGVAVIPFTTASVPTPTPVSTTAPSAVPTPAAQNGTLPVAEAPTING